MIFVLHFIAAVQIFFTLVTNYVQRHPLILCESTSCDHGNAIPEALPATWTSQRKVHLASTQKEDSTPSQVEAGTIGAQAPRSPFQRSNFHQSHQQRDDDRRSKSLVMPNMQEDLQCNTSVLRCMWDLMASLCRPILPATSETNQIAALSSMELCKRLDRTGLGGSSMGTTTNRSLSMDSVPKKAYLIKTEAIKESNQKRCRDTQRGQGQRQKPELGPRQNWSHLHCLPTQ